MSNLPPEIITDIISRLPIKSLIRFQCVSKRWYSLIKDPDFIKMHLKHSVETDREDVFLVQEWPEWDAEIQQPRDYYGVRFHDDGGFSKIVAIYPPPDAWYRVSNSCNGLVCIRIWRNQNEIAIWNPFIKKYKKLPIEPQVKIPTTPSVYDSPYCEEAFGFGYDPVNDDYKALKVVRFYEDYDITLAIEIKLYSLRTHSWKTISVQEEWPKDSFVCSESASLNGALHWLVICHRGESQFQETLIAFDLHTEKFRRYTTPFRIDRRKMTSLEVFGGCLSVCVHVHSTLWEFWVMKEYGMVSSWIRLHTFVLDGVSLSCKPVFLKNFEKVLLEVDGRNHFWYDIKGRRVEVLRMPEIQMMTWVESLVLLDGDSVSQEG